jgi:hypothetical protein
VALVLAVLLGSGVLPTGATGDPVRRTVATSPTRGEPLWPNLVVLQARDLSIQGAGTERRLRFESGLGSSGAGPVEVRPNRARPCPAGQHHATQVMYRDRDGDGAFARDTDTGTARRSAGCMVFHPHHDHWHFEAAARYRLFHVEAPGEEATVVRRKMSFCLRDSRPLPARFDVPTHRQHYGACSRYSPQGISVGWVDVYRSFLAGQAIRMTPQMGDGTYCLHLTVDPRDLLRESDETDNTSVRQFAIRGDRVVYRADNRRCRRLTGGGGGGTP